MSKATIERKVLVPCKEVYGHSLPHCLRHAARADALDEGKALLVFLRQVLAADDAYDSEGARGLDLVLALALDKIEIGSGDYKFPEMGWKDETPVLVERIEE